MIVKSEIEKAATTVYGHMQPTNHYNWPLLNKRGGANIWIKHENQTPIGAFKLRGGLVYMSYLTNSEQNINGVIAATRGNHGQSIAFAAAVNGIKATIIVPKGNSSEKNMSMSALGAELIEYGADFQEAYEYSSLLAKERELILVPSFSKELVTGVSTYAYEFFKSVKDLDVIYVPIGLGSGICGCIAAREALNLTTEIVGVVAENAPCYELSFSQVKAVSTNNSDTIADGLAVRTPDKDALQIINHSVDHIVKVSESEIKTAIRHYFSDTHNIAEGAGAAPLAAFMKEKNKYKGRNVGLILSGGNIDLSLFYKILEESYSSEPFCN